MNKNKIKKDEELSDELRRVAREGGTEAPFSGKYADSHEKGMFKCAICGAELFSSDAKFDSGTGWPSFTHTPIPTKIDNGVADAERKVFNTEISEKGGIGVSSYDERGFTEPSNLKHIELKEDKSSGMSRTEVLCKNCGAHLGHVFDDGPKEHGGKRFCINSVCLDLEKDANI